MRFESPLSMVVLIIFILAVAGTDVINSYVRKDCLTHGMELGYKIEDLKNLCR